MCFSTVRQIATAATLFAGMSMVIPAQAAEHIVKMLNAGAEGAMVFEPSFVSVEVGDTVVFTPTEPGAHNSSSIFLPEGAEPWTSAPDSEFKVTLDKEGVYLYACDPHKIMGMVGVIQVGNAVNLEEAKTKVNAEEAAFAMGKGRFSRAIAQVK